MFEVGDTIYYEEPLSHFICKAEILEYKESEHTIVKVHNLCYVDKDGKEIEKSYGVNYILGKIFKNPAEAYAHAEKEREVIIKKCCDLIKDVNDLVKFPLQHTLVGEFADWDAVDAYKIRVRELLNIEI